MIGADTGFYIATMTDKHSVGNLPENTPPRFSVSAFTTPTTIPVAEFITLPEPTFRCYFGRHD
jgi:hypothetical protein